jgi:hypothetical protein
MIIENINDNSRILPVFFNQSNLASLYYQIGIGVRINMPVQHDPFTHSLGIPAQSKTFNIVTNEVAYQHFFIGA